MFLDMTVRQNPEMIQTAVELHRKHKILPNTYVLDVEMIRYNAKRLVHAANRHNIKLYMMTKQLGRNPDLAKIITECGIEKAVAVDPWEAVELAKAGIKLGNVGHLVQIPSAMIPEILSYEPEVITVYTVEKAREISEHAEKLGRRQDILLRVVGNEDIIYEAQTGGFKEEQLADAALMIAKMPGVRIAGVTAFPCFLYQQDSEAIEKTKNAETLIRCVDLLESRLGIKIDQINTPSANTVSSFPLLAEIGATHAEPGHAITGTSPLHGYFEQEEIPAMVYVSEISHYFNNSAYAYGGGFYRRSQVKKALVGKSFNEMKDNVLEAETLEAEAIDYYGELKIGGGNRVEVGDTVIYAFRTQIFVTRSEVALVDGIHSGNPIILGIYDSLGKRLR